MCHYDNNHFRGSQYQQAFLNALCELYFCLKCPQNQTTQISRAYAKKII